MSLRTVRRRLGLSAVDFRETKPFLLGLVQAALAAVAFGLIFVVIVLTDITSLEPSPASATLSVLAGAVPAVILGAGVPYLVQYRQYFNRLNDSTTARLFGQFLTFGTYFALFFYDPPSSLIYAVAYLLSRVVVLVGIFAGSRIGA